MQLPPNSLKNWTKMVGAFMFHCISKTPTKFYNCFFSHPFPAFQELFSSDWSRKFPLALKGGNYLWEKFSNIMTIQAFACVCMHTLFIWFCYKFVFIDHKLVEKLREYQTLEQKLANRGHMGTNTWLLISSIDTVHMDHNLNWIQTNRSIDTFHKHHNLN